nr:DUF29 domain-containing protein [Polymorphobacter sp.]
MNEHVAFKRPAADDLYEADFYAWLQSQADLLRRRRFDRLDLENIIEEIDSLGREQIHSVEKHIIRAAEHLVKLAVSEDAEPRQGWKDTVNEQRRRLARRLKMNPSLRPKAPELFAAAWPDIVAGAIAGLRRDAEREHAASMAPFTYEQLVSTDFFPPKD